MRHIESILRDLQRIAIDNHRCFGCGRENSCSIHGCAVIREAADCIRSLSNSLSASEQARSELGQRLVLAQSQLYDAEVAAGTLRRFLGVTQATLDKARGDHE